MKSLSEQVLNNMNGLKLKNNENKIKASNKFNESTKDVTSKIVQLLIYDLDFISNVYENNDFSEYKKALSDIKEKMLKEVKEIEKYLEETGNEPDYHEINSQMKTLINLIFK